MLRRVFTGIASGALLAGLICLGIALLDHDARWVEFPPLTEED